MTAVEALRRARATMNHGRDGDCADGEACPGFSDTNPGHEIIKWAYWGRGLRDSDYIEGHDITASALLDGFGVEEVAEADLFWDAVAAADHTTEEP